MPTPTRRPQRVAGRINRPAATAGNRADDDVARAEADDVSSTVDDVTAEDVTAEPGDSAAIDTSDAAEFTAVLDNAVLGGSLIEPTAVESTRAEPTSAEVTRSEPSQQRGPKREKRPKPRPGTSSKPTDSTVADKDVDKGVVDETTDDATVAIDDITADDTVETPKPRPRAKRDGRRSSNELAGSRPGSRGADSGGVAGAGTAPAGPTWRGYPVRVPAILAAIGLLLGGFALAAGIVGHNVSNGYANQALVDAQGTKDVSTQVGNALNTLLTFDYTQPNKTQQAAAPLIDGNLSADCDANTRATDYNKLIDTLKSQAVKEQLSLKSTTVLSGVQSLQDDQAQLLAFVTEVYTKGSGKSAKQSSVPAAIRVNAVFKDGRWKLNRMCVL